MTGDLIWVLVARSLQLHRPEGSVTRGVPGSCSVTGSSPRGRFLRWRTAVCREVPDDRAPCAGHDLSDRPRTQPTASRAHGRLRGRRPSCSLYRPEGPGPQRGGTRVLAGRTRDLGPHSDSVTRGLCDIQLASLTVPLCDHNGADYLFICCARDRTQGHFPLSCIPALSIFYFRARVWLSSRG